MDEWYGGFTLDAYMEAYACEVCGDLDCGGHEWIPCDHWCHTDTSYSHTDEGVYYSLLRGTKVCGIGWQSGAVVCCPKCDGRNGAYDNRWKMGWED